MKNVFITGATGLVGGYMLRAFVEAGYRVKAIRRSLSDVTFLGEYAQKVEWVEGDILDVLFLSEAIEPESIVIHAAAMVSFQRNDKKKMFQANVEGTANVVNICLEKNSPKFIHISSIASLGRKKEALEIDEEATWQESDLNTAYAESKYLSELEVWRGVSEGLQAVILNPSLVFGVGDWTKTSMQLFKYVADGKKMYPIGSVNYVDVRDIAKAALLLAQSPIHSERFVMSAGTMPYKELFEKIAQQLHKKPPSVPVKPFLATLAWCVSRVASWFTRKPPLISRETALASQQNFVYKSDKIKMFLPDFTFTPLDTTIGWVVSKKI